VQAIERIVFFGTPTFAVPALEALVAADRTPLLVVSQPARPAGRGRSLVEPPLAVRARELGLVVEQPAKVREPEFVERLRGLRPDLAVVVAFGQIFPPALLALPRLGCINVHASLLPRWRGAAPIAAAIAAGDAETGVSIQQMEAGLDSGPVFVERRTPIGESETTGELTDRLARLGADLLVDLLPRLERGEVEATPQDPSGVTLAPKLGPPLVLDLTRSADWLARQVRAYHPGPGTTLVVGGEIVKVLSARAVAAGASELAGTVLGVDERGLQVAAGGGSAIELVTVQRAGGRAIGGRDLANGLRLRRGDRVA